MKIIQVAAMLHNFVIDNDGCNFVRVSNDDYATLEVVPMVSVEGVTIAKGNRGFANVLPSRDKESDYRPSSDDEERFKRREHLLSEIASRDLRRPARNIARNLDIVVDAHQETQRNPHTDCEDDDNESVYMEDVVDSDYL